MTRHAMITNAMRTAATFALGVGLAASAQAQGNPPAGTTPDTTMPHAAAPPAATQHPEHSATSMAPGANTGAGAMASGRSADASAGRNVSQAEIRQAQEELRSKGLYRGQIDGIAGPETEAALARFQDANGLPRTSRLDRDTLARLTGNGTTGFGSSEPGAGAGSNSPTVLRGASPNNPMVTPTPNGAGPDTNGAQTNPKY